MFTAFTDSARKTITRAMHASQRLRHDHIGSEHLLLGLLEEPDDMLAMALTNLALDRTAARRQIELLAGVGKHHEQMAPLPFTPQAKAVLERAMEASRSLGHHYIEHMHLLLGVIGDTDSIATEVLTSLGATPERVRSEILELVGQTAQPSHTERPGLVLSSPGVSEALVTLQGVDRPLPATIGAALDGASSVEFGFAIPRAALERMLAVTPEGGSAQGRLTITNIGTNGER